MENTRNLSLSIADTFQLEGVPQTVLTTGFQDDTHPLIPTKDEGYVFRRELLRDILAFLDNPRGDGLFFAGHYGCGKTSLPAQVAARLNWPVLTADGSEEFNVEDLLGRPDLQNGSGTFLYGALSKAMKEGYLFVFNEIDTVPAGRLTAIHDVLEGRPLILHGNGGEVIKPHPNFRLIATGNSIGSGDDTGLYQGVSVQNIAFMDRFRVCEVSYPDEAIEMAILEKATPQLPQAIRQKMVKTANEIRRLFIGGSSVDSTLTITMSTRALVRWAYLTMDFRNAGSPVMYALGLSLTSKAVPEQREAIEELTRSVFGDELLGNF
ncbi:MAG: CbbQ/NirQ/NorQ C-terminal domain-containing protein [Thiotrichales bacterium]|nr:CbbQ/NirQ/NorQ C-terminal domain-containing protein [Thiotrichales bacterium]